jgi:hypothetical protein
MASPGKSDGSPAPFFRNLLDWLFNAKSNALGM